jgi:hypothetical protein
MPVFYDLVLLACALEGCRIEARGDKRYALAGTRMFVVLQVRIAIKFDAIQENDSKSCIKSPSS